MAVNTLLYVDHGRYNANDFVNDITSNFKYNTVHDCDQQKGSLRN